MDKRREFLKEVNRGELGMAALCRAFGVSRKTGYKWLKRYESFGIVGFVEHSRAPHGNSRATPPEVVAKLAEARGKHPFWGPRKLLAWLSARDPSAELPAHSTASSILARLGLVEPRRRRRRAPPHVGPRCEAEAPNRRWDSDFKGHFALGNGQRCHPLTITDACSRFLIKCHALARPTGAASREVFESAFREYGLPDVIRTDNGPPFASVGAGGLTPLSVWWVKLGVLPERITPGKPQENGQHERMHRTLKAETTQPPRYSLRAQALEFARFRQEFNVERPHEALGQRAPASLYTPSPRPYPRGPLHMEYPRADEVRRVDQGGHVRWRGRSVAVTTSLVGEWIALDQVEDGIWEARFGPVVLGRLDDACPKLGLIHPRRLPVRQRQPL